MKEMYRDEGKRYSFVTKRHLPASGRTQTAITNKESNREELQIQEVPRIHEEPQNQEEDLGPHD